MSYPICKLEVNKTPVDKEIAQITVPSSDNAGYSNFILEDYIVPNTHCWAIMDYTSDSNGRVRVSTMHHLSKPDGTDTLPIGSNDAPTFIDPTSDDMKRLLMEKHNLLPEHIVKDVTVCGVTGTHEDTSSGGSSESDSTRYFINPDFLNTIKMQGSEVLTGRISAISGSNTIEITVTSGSLATSANPRYFITFVGNDRNKWNDYTDSNNITVFPVFAYLYVGKRHFYLSKYDAGGLSPMGSSTSSINGNTIKFLASSGFIPNDAWMNNGSLNTCTIYRIG